MLAMALERKKLATTEYTKENSFDDAGKKKIATNEYTKENSGDGAGKEKACNCK